MPKSTVFSGLSLKKLIHSKHGINLGELKPSIPKCLTTHDKMIDLAPDMFFKALEDALENHTEIHRSKKNEFLLIGRRNVLTNNSWMHQVERLSSNKNTRCTAMINTEDASALNLNDTDEVWVESGVGEIVIPIEITDDIMHGVISIPHGFGHTRADTINSHAKANPGVSVNDITDNKRVDSLTGNAAFSGQKVTLKKYKRGNNQ